MTLSARNSFFKGGIILSAISLGLVAAGGYFLFSAYPEAAASASMRTHGLIQWIISGLVQPSAYVPYWSMLGAVAYSLISIILIFYFFEKTQAPEILFFAFFAMSMSFEIVRMVVPLKEVLPFPAIYLISSSRILIFGRYFGLFSLFAAGVYAAGLDVQKQQNVFFLSVLAAMIIAMNVPIDSLVWDSSFVLLSGYRSMFSMVELGILLVTVTSFFVSAYIRSSKSYIIIGIGAIMAFAGRNMLLLSDTWITPLPGLLILAAGTWLACIRLHREYLWF
ncbi:MAG: hypothetical protein FWH19_03950 [Treponema sp.]|nr:hypothetical protein [Treponema sp.]